MASTTVRIGLNARLYMNTGTYGTPTWTEIDNVRDLTIDLDMDEADASIRGGSGWAYSEPTLLRAVVTFQMNHDPADTNGWDAINTAFLARTAKELLIIDRATGTGAEGLRVTIKFFKFGTGQPLAGVQTTDVVAKPVNNANAVPAWYVGA